MEKVSLRLQQIDVVCETKTKDNVCVYLSIVIAFSTISCEFIILGIHLCSC